MKIPSGLISATAQCLTKPLTEQHISVYRTNEEKWKTFMKLYNESLPQMDLAV